MADNGYSYPFTPDRCVITIFTASRYAGEFHNKAAFLTINHNLDAAVSVPTHKDRRAPAAKETRNHPQDTNRNARRDHKAATKETGPVTRVMRLPNKDVFVP
jgi:serine/threonine-protein phosphatase PP1 catalytic subunit